MTKRKTRVLAALVIGAATIAVVWGVLPGKSDPVDSQQVRELPLSAESIADGAARGTPKPGRIEADRANAPPDDGPAATEEDANYPAVDDAPERDFSYLRPEWHEIAREWYPGWKVNLFRVGGPIFTPDGELVFYGRATADGSRTIRTYTFGFSRPDDLETHPTIKQLVEEFGVWMPREDGTYEHGFVSAEGDFYRFPRNAQTSMPRPREDVPQGRDILPVGSQSIWYVPGTGLVSFAMLKGDGGFAIPVLRVQRGDNAAGEERERLLKFEGYPRIAIDRVAYYFEKFAGVFFGLTASLHKVVTIPKPAE